MPRPRSNIEKRKSQRIYCCLPIKYKEPGSSSFRKGIACQDMSGGGLGITLHHPLKIKDKIGVMLYLDGESGPINAICKVIWCRQKEDGRFRAGLKFIKVKDHERFLEYVCEKIIDLSLETS